MTKFEVRRIQKALNAAGANPQLVVDGIWGPKTEEAFQKDQARKKGTPAPISGKPVNPAYVEAKKHVGKGEHDKRFVVYLSGFWKKVGLPNYKTIIGSSFAWCGLFVAAMNTETGLSIIKGAAGARNWAKYGVEVDYRKNGAARGSVVHINHGRNCKSGKGNHVAFLDGDCTADDLTRPGGIVALYGGNQSNRSKRSYFSNTEICEIRWPEEIPKPGKITQSVDCTSKEASGESTR